LPEDSAATGSGRQDKVRRTIDDEPVDHLLLRLRTLEDQVQSLRFSRRVLMNLLIAADRERRVAGSRLEAENQRLRRDNQRLSRLLQVRGGGSDHDGENQSNSSTD